MRISSVPASYFELHDERHLMESALTVVGPSAGLQRCNRAVVKVSYNLYGRGLSFPLSERDWSTCNLSIPAIGVPMIFHSRYRSTRIVCNVPTYQLTYLHSCNVEPAIGVPMIFHSRYRSTIIVPTYQLMYERSRIRNSYKFVKRVKAS